MGWVATTPSLPLVHAANQVHVRTPASVGEALAVVQREQEGLAFRHLEVSHAGSAEGLIGALRGSGGWRIDREVVMALGEGVGGRRVGVGSISVLDEGEADHLMRRWLVEDHFDSTEGMLDQLSEYTRREGRLWRERVLGVRDESGRPVAMTKLRIEGDVGWVEDVYTVPEARGRGYARALVTHAADRARSAGPGLVFILADDEDWPKNLYFDVGFRPVGNIWTFHREEVA